MTLIISFLFICSSNLNFHPVHVSVTNMDIDISQNKIDFSTRINSQDMEYAIIHMFDVDISLTDSITINEKNEVNRYMTSAIIISNNGFHINLNLQDIQIRDDLIWVFYQGYWEGDIPDYLYLENRILLDLFLDQTNLVIINIDGKEYGITFDYKNQENEVRIK